MATTTVKGHVPAAVTPFSEKGDLMLDAFAEILAWHMDCDCGGFLILGDNGESWAVSEDELKQITRTAMKTAAGRVPVFVGTSAVTTAETVARSVAAADAGADGICLQPQSYVLSGTQSEIVRRFEAVAKAAPLPMMVYNTPLRTGMNIDHDTLEAILGVAPVVAIKESNEDMKHASRTLLQFRDRIAVFIGNGENILPAILLGSAGFISTGPDLFGKETNRLLEAESMSIAERLQWQERLIAVFGAVLGTGTRPSGYKAALNMLGLPAGYPREPVEPLTPDDQAKVRRVLVECGILGHQAADRAAS